MIWLQRERQPLNWRKILATIWYTFLIGTCVLLVFGMLVGSFLMTVQELGFGFALFMWVFTFGGMITFLYHMGD